MIKPRKTIYGRVGSVDHSTVLNRNLQDQHPIEAITGLSDKLEELEQQSVNVKEFNDVVSDFDTYKSKVDALKDDNASLEINKVDKIYLQDKMIEIQANYTKKDFVEEELKQKADLIDGLVPTTQLPDFENVVYRTSSKYFPPKGVQGKVYIDGTTNYVYR